MKFFFFVFFFFHLDNEAAIENAPDMVNTKSSHLLEFHIKKKNKHFFKSLSQKKTNKQTKRKLFTFDEPFFNKIAFFSLLFKKLKQLFWKDCQFFFFFFFLFVFFFFWWGKLKRKFSFKKKKIQKLRIHFFRTILRGSFCENK